MATVYKRGNVWWIRVQHRGTEIRRSAGTSSKREAREYLARVIADLSAQKRGDRPVRTFEDAAVIFMQTHVPSLKPSSVASYQYIIRTLAAHFGGLDLHDITRRAILDFEAVQPVGRARLQRYRAVLSGIMKAAQARDWIETNPVRGLPPLRVKNARQAFLSRTEWPILRDKLSPTVILPSGVAITTGMREGEIVGLRVRDLDFERDEIHIRDAKTGERTIPMEDAREWFPAQLSAHPDAPVFATSTGAAMRADNLSKRFRRDADRAGFPHIRFHDLRHTFASWWMQGGGDSYVLQCRLGHSGPAMTQRYAHLRTEDLRR